MKLVAAIVQKEDAGHLIDALMEKEFKATRINTAGGFLKSGNTTILVGVEDARLDDVLELIRISCHARSQRFTPIPPVMEPGSFYVPTPIEVEVGGATVWVLSVERHERL